MLKNRIAMLVASALFTAHAGADVWQPDAASLDEISPPGQIALFDPEGESYAVVPAEQLFVFEPDGLILSYAAVPALESYVILSDQYPAPEQLTVFTPDGSSYELAPIGMVSSEPLDAANLTAADVYKMAYTYVANYVSPPAYQTSIE
jgi:hypothetical protein